MLLRPFIRGCLARICFEGDAHSHRVSCRWDRAFMSRISLLANISGSSKSLQPLQTNRRKTRLLVSILERRSTRFMLLFHNNSDAETQFFVANDVSNEHLTTYSSVVSRPFF